ncbi:MAG TPA: hypothetical protein VE291_08210 [Terracidiphilus sp.]|nr:hypothetical protein [Terracidiphilus sp.]
MKEATAARWFWVATIVNAVATILLVLLIYGALVMLAMFSSPTSMIPFFLLPAIVLLLSAAGLFLVRGLRNRFGRWIGYAVHTGGFLLSFLMLAYLGFLWSGIGSGKETYLIPDGYQGEVSIIYPVTHGSMKPRGPRTAVYTIPSDGVLVASNPEVTSWSGWTKTRYYYVSNGGVRREITEHWDSTIPETPENLSNTKDIGIYRETTGYSSDAKGCTFQTSQFYVGTKAYLLRKSKPIDLEGYSADNSLGCSVKR